MGQRIRLWACRAKRGAPQTVECVQNSQILLIESQLSKTRVFERGEARGKIREKNGLNVSQNSILIPASQKLYDRLSLERAVHAEEKARSAVTASRSGRGRSGARKAARATSSPRLDGEAPSKGMLIGCAWVSTIDQNLALQRDALAEAGCGRIFTEQLSGAVTDRPALHDALEFARSGDTLIVWKLDRLARSMKQLIETIEKLRLMGIGSAA